MIAFGSPQVYSLSMILVINSLIPVFALIGLGAALRRGGFLDAAITGGFNKLAYWVALPVLLFYKLSQAPISVGAASNYFYCLLAATLLSALITWGIAATLKTPMRSTGVMVQGALRGNLAFVGLPIVLFVIGHLPETERAALESSVVLGITFTIILYSLLSVSVLVFFNRDQGAKLEPKVFWRNVLKNPLAIGCISGVLANQVGLQLPPAVDRTMASLAPAAFPVALLGIGSQLAATKIRSHVIWALITSFVKTAISPLIGYAAGRLLGMSGLELQVAVLFCAMPTAVSSYILADQMNADADLAASAVVVCTILSFFSLSTILLLSF